MPDKTPVSPSPALEHQARNGHSSIPHILIIVALGLLMLIPLFLIKQVIQERSTRYHSALEKVAADWGARQTLVGPVLVIPYLENIRSVESALNGAGEPVTSYRNETRQHTAILLPENLEVRTDLLAEERQQGIYDAPVYTAKVNMTGNFNHAALLQQPLEGKLQILWEQAYIIIGLSDTRAIDTTSGFFWNDSRIQPRPGSNLPHLLPTGIHAPLQELNGSNTLHEFKFNMAVRGSEGFYIAPLGQNTLLRVTSGWTKPDFSSDMPPEKKEISDQGFNAEWQISWLARHYPQYWLLDKGSQYDLYAFTAGAGLGTSASQYTRILTSITYGPLMIGLTFLVMLAFALRQQPDKTLTAILPYAVSGILLSVFYLLLLALSEHLEFLYAYIAAAAFTALMVSLYAWRAWRNKGLGFSLVVLLGALYGLQYLLLEMPDYALLALTGLLLLATGLIMLMNRPLPTHTKTTR